MNQKDLLTENTVLIYRHRKLLENNSMTYEKDKIYKASYIDSANEEHFVTFTPNKDMNIVELIKFIQSKHDDFFKLYGVVENKTESVSNLTENEDIEDITDYKTYIMNKLKNNAEFIEAVSEDKPNRYKENGIHIYGYDYYEENDNKPFGGFQAYIPYNITKENLDNILDQVNKNIETVYKDSIKLKHNKEVS